MSILPGIKDLVRKQPVTVVSILVYNVTPLIGVFTFGWDVEQLVLLYWFEALALIIYELIAALITGPRLRTDKRIKRQFVAAAITFFVVFQLFFVFASYQEFMELFADSFLGHSVSNNLAVIKVFVAASIVPLLALVVTYGSALIKLAQDKSVARPTNNLAVRWLWQVFLPLEFAIILLQVKGTYAVTMLVSIIVVKLVIDIWQNLAVNNTAKQKEAKKISVTHIGQHPFSLWSTGTPIMLYLAAIFIFLMSNPDNWDPTVSNELNLLGFVAIGLVMLYITIPPRHELFIDKNKQELVLEHGRFFRRQKSVKLADLHTITDRKNKQGLAIGYDVNKNQNNYLSVLTLFFSKIELYDFFNYLKEQYPGAKINISKDPPIFHS